MALVKRPHPRVPGIGGDAPENGYDVVVGEDADSPGDQGDALEPTILVLPQDPDAFSPLQVQLIGSVGGVGVQSYKPGGHRALVKDKEYTSRGGGQGSGEGRGGDGTFSPVVSDNNLAKLKP